eukprot:2635487-Rhodomonas_salina.3
MIKIDRLPSKAVFGSMSPSRIANRQKCLDSYLKVSSDLSPFPPPSFPGYPFPPIIPLLLCSSSVVLLLSLAPPFPAPVLLPGISLGRQEDLTFFFLSVQSLLKEAELVSSPELHEFLEIPLEAAISDDEPETSKKSDKSRSALLPLCSSPTSVLFPNVDTLRENCFASFNCLRLLLPLSLTCPVVCACSGSSTDVSQAVTASQSPNATGRVSAWQAEAEAKWGGRESSRKTA